MKILWIFDDGHGVDTKGKRTPKFPDGTQMQDNTFNRAVVDQVLLLLEPLGISAVRLKPEQNDVPVATRVKREKTMVAKQIDGEAFTESVLVSVNVNADGVDWGSSCGIETAYYSDKSLAVAEIFQSNLVRRCFRKNRGVKKEPFYLLQKCSSPAVLVKCGFSTNSEEAIYLMSETYRTMCAEAIVDAVVETQKLDKI